MKDKTILAVAAHTDDLDFGCGGSMALWSKRGARVYYFLLTDGSKGSEDMSISGERLSILRQQEQMKAAQIIGVKKVFFGGFMDGELQNSAEVRYEIVILIRKLKPDIVVTTDPNLVYDVDFGLINHPDHRNAGQATLDSIYPYARNSRTFPDLLEQGLKPHSVKQVLLLNFARGNFTVDITETFSQKIEALKAHKSQISDFGKFSRMMEQRGKMLAEKISGKYAESFIRLNIHR